MRHSPGGETTRVTHQVDGIGETMRRTTRLGLIHQEMLVQLRKRMEVFAQHLVEDRDRRRVAVLTVSLSTGRIAGPLISLARLPDLDFAMVGHNLSFGLAGAEYAEYETRSLTSGKMRWKLDVGPSAASVPRDMPVASR